MVSGFISEKDGYLKLTNEEYNNAKETYPKLKTANFKSIPRIW